jgi:hypothetical protein
MNTALARAPDRLTRLAYLRYKRLLSLGDEVEERRRKQLDILHWFWMEPRRYRAIGFDSFDELFMQEDVQRALKLTAMSQGARSKSYGLLKIDVVIPEADVLGPGRSKVAAALPELRPLADKALEAPPREREPVKQELWRKIDEYRALPVREVESQVQTQRELPYRLTSNGGHPAIGKVDGETGELSILLVQADDCDPVGFATVIRRLTRNYSTLLWDDDGLWTWAGEGILKPIARWPNPNLSSETKQAIAEACRAERRI